MCRSGLTARKTRSRRAGLDNQLRAGHSHRSLTQSLVASSCGQEVSIEDQWFGDPQSGLELVVDGERGEK
jgi:hypothetical protein